MRPAIIEMGIATDKVISGWTLAPCMSNCNCHRGSRGELKIFEGTDSIGLWKSSPCSCCLPWTADELEAMIDALTEIELLDTIKEAPWDSL